MGPFVVCSGIQAHNYWFNDINFMSKGLLTSYSFSEGLLLLTLYGFKHANHRLPSILGRIYYFSAFFEMITHSIHNFIASQFIVSIIKNDLLANTSRMRVQLLILGKENTDVDLRGKGCRVGNQKFCNFQNYFLLTN